MGWLGQQRSECPSALGRRKASVPATSHKHINLKSALVARW
jgi:hypothetical protein